jgi:hypothetical protein
MINAYLSDRYRMRGTGVIVMSILAVIGYCSECPGFIAIELTPSLNPWAKPNSPLEGDELTFERFAVFLTTDDKWTKYGSLFFSIVGVYGTAPA